MFQLSIFQGAFHYSKVLTTLSMKFIVANSNFLLNTICKLQYSVTETKC